MSLFFWFLVGITALSIWSGFFARRQVFQYRARTSAVVGLVLVGIAGFFEYRTHVAFRELAALVALPPGRSRHMYVPREKEMRAWSSALQVKYDTAEFAGRPDYWIVETKLSIDSVLAFYRGPGRRDWRIAEEYKQTLVLRREGQEMRIVAAQPTWKPATTILYSLEQTPP